MDSKKILRNMTNIDDSFIEEAARSRGERTVMETKKTGKKGRWKLWTGVAAAALAVCVGIGGIAGGWFGGYAKSASDSYRYTGAGMKNEAMEAPQASYDNGEWVAEAEPQDWAYAEESKGMNASNVATANKTDEGTTNPTSDPKADVKLIYRANISIQTTDFEEAIDGINKLISECGGYIESSESDNGSYYSQGSYHRAYICVRVPSDKYRQFVDGVNGNCYVTNINESVEDVGLAYYEIEGRLRTLYTKQERLNELLSQAITMGDIIDLENALADTEWQIDMYKSNLNRYDSLINYSTVNLNIEQVSRPGGSVVEDQGFFARLGRALKNGAANFLDGIGNFVLWISYNLLTLILIAVIVIVIRLVWLKIKRNRERRRNNTPEQQ
jgi:hypothetical protein